MIKAFPETEAKIVQEYVSNGLSAREVKEKLRLDLSIRQIQRILGKHGVIRSRGDSFRLAVSQNKVKYYRKPPELKKRRKHIDAKSRYFILTRDGFKCLKCGSSPKDGIRLEVDHIDKDTTNNDPSNLQTVCDICNKGRQ